MSQQRFVRCPHCGLPHEAEEAVCPVTGQPIELEKKPRRAKPPPSEEGYAWAHSVHSQSVAKDPDRDLLPEELDTFVGQLVEDKYRIQALIGRGGMGAVFRAENERIGKPVALKVLYRGYEPGSHAERRFLREARIAGSIGHPHIVQVFDLGHLDDGKPFQVMELLEGQSLAERLRLDGALPEDEVLDIAAQVLSALSAAHERGIVHRDLKPENVFLVERRGETIAKLLDFGVSKSLTEQTLSLTMTGVVVGTPYYLSPEQARGERAVDHRIDIWAMGVSMYEALTGVLPFNAESYEKLLSQIRKCAPAPPSRFQPRLTPAVEAVILRALSSSPADRPTSADAMLAELLAARTSALASAAATPAATFARDPSVTERSAPGPDDPTEVSDSFVSDDVRVAIEGAGGDPDAADGVER